MRRLEIRHAPTSNLIYVSKRVRSDDVLEKLRLSKSAKTGFADFDQRFFISCDNGDLLSQTEIRAAILAVSELPHFRSIELRPEFIRLIGPENNQQTEAKVRKLASAIGDRSAASTPARPDEAAQKIFDLYSPPHWLTGLLATAFLAGVILITSVWLSENLVNVEKSLAILIATNSILFILALYAFRAQIQNLRLPSRALILHGVSTFLLVIFCGAGFEVFANAAFDSSEATEISLPITSKTAEGKVSVHLPQTGREITFELNENQSSKVTLGHSAEVLGIHRGLFFQPWFQAKRLEY